MSNTLQNPLALAGRLLLAGFFLPAGVAKIAGFSGMVGYANSVGLPLPQLGIAAAIGFEVLGGLALLLGLGTRWAALALAVFTLTASFFFHAYWAAPADAQMVQQLLFNKNLAVVGGLLVLAAFGPGAWSMDARRAG